MTTNIPRTKVPGTMAGWWAWRLSLQLPHAAGLCALLLALLASGPAWGVTVPSIPDLSCLGERYGGTNCTANDFTVSASFSAAPGTPPFCAQGQSFEFEVDMLLTSNSPDRYDVGIYFGQNGNDPTSLQTTDKCSVATFPVSAIPSAPPTLTQPWGDLGRNNACADFLGGGSVTTRFNKIKVLCQGDATGALLVPYTLVYSNNKGTPTSCTGPADVVPGTTSKCQGSATGTVSGVVPVNTGAYVDVTKRTTPGGDSQPFAFTATGPAGSKVIALVNGIYTPASLTSATNSITITLTDGQTARFFINALAADQTLTITEAAAANWESTAAISCAAVTGSPALTTDNVNRSMSAALNTTNSAAACTITNTKKATVTLQKNIAGRVAADDQFALAVSDATATTTGSTTGLQGVSASKTVSGGTAVTLSEAISGTGTLLSQYSQTISCTNTLAGSPTVLPAGAVTGFPINLTPAAGDNITCTITNRARPTIAKTFGVTNLASGGNTSLTVSIGNPNAGAITLTSALTDTFPAGMTINTAGNTGTCTGVTAAAGAGSFTMASGTAIPAGGCTVIVDVTCSTAGTSTNTVAAGALQTSVGSNVASASASLNVHAPPTVAKAFGAATIASGSATTLILALGNPATNPANITTNRVDDTFPPGLTLQDTTFTFTPAACGTVTSISGAASAIGDNNIRFSSASIAPGASCQVQVSVTSSTTGTTTNTTGVPTATGPVALSGRAADATLTVIVGISVTGRVYADQDHNGTLDAGEAGTGQLLYVKLTPRSGPTCVSPALAAAAASPGTGAYSLPVATAGDYCLILDDNTALSDAIPTRPAGWLATESPTGMLQFTVGSTPLTSRNFGLYHGSRLSGKVFSDTGIGSGVPNNAVPDGAETGLAGVTVKIADSGGGTVYDTTASSGNGDYTLWIPAAAGNNALRVVETNLSTYVSTGGSPGDTTGNYDRASDTVAFANAVGSTYSGVNFADVPASTFVDSNSRSIVAGEVTSYPHTFIAGTGGNVAFTVSAVGSPVLAGWSEVLYLDSNCNGSLDAGEPQITASLATAAGQQICLILKESAPAAAPPNAVNTATVSANFEYSNASPALAGTHTVTDISTVIMSGLTLLKYVDKSSALPGDALIYTISYINTGFSQLSNIVISDNIPPYTALIDTTPASICCVGPSATCLGSPASPYPASITGCTVMTSSSSISWALSGTLAPGASGAVKFRVRIDQ